MERWAERQEVVSVQWVAYALRSQWKWVATGVALGVALALGIVLFGERRYEAEGRFWWRLLQEWGWALGAHSLRWWAAAAPT
jgi:hypothetical protein